MPVKAARSGSQSDAALQFGNGSGFEAAELQKGVESLRDKPLFRRGSSEMNTLSIPRSKRSRLELAHGPPPG
jgi:hypothetical protein